MASQWRAGVINLAGPLARRVLEKICVEYIQYVYELLQVAGREFGIANIGYRAIDSPRIEKRTLPGESTSRPTTTRSRPGCSS